MAKPIKDNPTIQGKAAKQFVKMFLRVSRPSPERVEQNKRDVKTFRTEEYRKYLEAKRIINKGGIMEVKMGRPKLDQEDSKYVFGIGQKVLVRTGTVWHTREILGITVLRNGEPRFWFKDYGNVSFDEIKVTDIS